MALKKIDHSSSALSIPSLPVVRNIRSSSGSAKFSVISSADQNKTNSFCDCIKKIGRVIADFFRRLFCCKPKAGDIEQSSSKEITQLSHDPIVKEVQQVKNIIEGTQKRLHEIQEAKKRDDAEFIKEFEAEKLKAEKEKAQKLAIIEQEYQQRRKESELRLNACDEKFELERRGISATDRVHHFYEYILLENPNIQLGLVNTELDNLLKVGTQSLKILRRDYVHVVPASKEWTDEEFIRNYKRDCREAANKNCVRDILVKSGKTDNIDEVQDKKESSGWVKKDVQLLSTIVAKMEAGPVVEGEAFNSLVQDLDALVPYYDVPANVLTEGSPEEGTAALGQKMAAKQQQLLGALKAHQVAQRSLSKVDAQKEGEILTLKSQVCRLNDLIDASKNPRTRPQYPVFLKLAEQVDASQWAKMGDPATVVPAYLSKYAHAADSDEDGIDIAALLMGGPRRDPAYHGTMQYVQELVLKTPLETLSASELEKLFYTLFLKMSGSKGNPDETLLRKMEMLVWKEALRKNPTPQGVNQVLGKHDPASASAFVETVGFVKRWGSMENAATVFSERHWKAYEQLSSIPPADPKQVPALMKAFFVQLEQHLKNPKLHPYQVASFIQYALASIHPFGDGNGRMARLLMNIHFMQKGMRPIIILNDAKFQKLFEEKDFEAAFCAYLQKAHENMEILIANGRLAIEANAEDEKQEAPSECARALM